MIDINDAEIEFCQQDRSVEGESRKLVSVYMVDLNIPNIKITFGFSSW